MKNLNKTFALDQAMFDWIKAKSEERDVTDSQIIREAIKLAMAVEVPKKGKK